MQRRGQAAMEFLMTYGWAILAAVVVIAVLASFGVFNPGNYRPKACVIQAPFGCSESLINTTGVYLVIQNGGGETLNLTSVDVTNCGTTSNIGAVTQGSSVMVPISCSLTSGSDFRGTITITYRKINGQLDQTTSGTLTGKVA